MTSDRMPSIAMVFAAGLGTRMRPLTDTVPKPLIRVGGRTLLDHALDRLADVGVERAVVNVHYRAEQITAHLAGRARPSVMVSDERDHLLDQAGGIIRALPKLGRDPFWIVNTDALWTGDAPNLRRLAEAWDGQRMDVLLLLAPTETSLGVDWGGDFRMADDGRLDRERNERLPYVYAGVGLIKADLFKGLDEEPLRLAPFFFRAVEQGRLHGIALEGTWLHVGTPAAVIEADAVLANGADDITKSPD